MTYNFVLDTEEQTVEISQLVFYMREPDTPENNAEQEYGSIDRFITQFQRAKCIACNYTFQRTYTNGIGGSWVATVVNHFSPVSRILGLLHRMIFSVGS